MFIARNASAAVLALVLVTGCREGLVKHSTIERSFPAGSIRDLELHASSGDVDIRVGPSVTVTATVEAIHQHKGKREESELVEFEVKDGRLVISEKKEGGRSVSWLPFLRKPSAEISYQITVPATLPLTIENVNGSIRSEGVGGSVRFETVNGAVSATRLTGKVDARTVNGKVFVGYSGVFEGAALSSVNGSIRIELPPDASFHTDISQVNGTFRSNVPMTFGSDGARGVNGGQHALELSTINGSIEVVQSAPDAAPPAAPGS